MRYPRRPDPYPQHLLTPEIFSRSIAAPRGKLKEWLEKPSDKPFVIAADSREEALAFLACLFDGEQLRQYKDITAVFTSPQTLRTLVASSVPFIPITRLTKHPLQWW